MALGNQRSNKLTDPKPPRDSDEQREQEKWYEKTLYQILLLAGGIALFGLVLGLILDWYIDPQTSTQKKDLVQALGLITAGVAGGIGILFTWRGQRQARQAQEKNQENTQEQLQNAHIGLELTRQGQLTERFTRAIDQLGARDDNNAKAMEMRLGGVYALERIAKESPQDYWPIIEILTAYVRRHVPRRGGRVLDQFTPDIEALTPDIQAILTVLGRRPSSQKEGKAGQRIDLRQTELYRADLQKANLREANLQGANLRSARLQEAYLQGAYLLGTTLESADLQGANLQGANLQGANLQGANLQGASLPKASLLGANLISADLQGANLREAVLREARLEGTNLYGASYLTQEQIESAIGQAHTKLPEGLNYPEFWSQSHKEQTLILQERWRRSQNPI